jgi:hypothetical protein
LQIKLSELELTQKTEQADLVDAITEHRSRPISPYHKYESEKSEMTLSQILKLEEQIDYKEQAHSLRKPKFY